MIVGKIIILIIVGVAAGALLAGAAMGKNGR